MGSECSDASGLKKKKSRSTDCTGTHMCDLSNVLWVHSVLCAVYSQSTKMAPKHGGLENHVPFSSSMGDVEVSVCR